MHEPIAKIISYQLDIKLGQFIQELDLVLWKIKNRKAAGIISYQLDIKLGQFIQELDLIQWKIKNRKAAGNSPKSMEEMGIWWHTALIL